MTDHPANIEVLPATQAVNPAAGVTLRVERRALQALSGGTLCVILSPDLATQAEAVCPPAVQLLSLDDKNVIWARSDESWKEEPLVTAPAACLFAGYSEPQCASAFAALESVFEQLRPPHRPPVHRVSDATAKGATEWFLRELSHQAATALVRAYRDQAELLGRLTQQRLDSERLATELRALERYATALGAPRLALVWDGQPGEETVGPGTPRPAAVHEDLLPVDAPGVATVALHFTAPASPLPAPSPDSALLQVVLMRESGTQEFGRWTVPYAAVRSGWMSFDLPEPLALEPARLRLRVIWSGREGAPALSLSEKLYPVPAAAVGGGEPTARRTALRIWRAPPGYDQPAGEWYAGPGARREAAEPRETLVALNSEALGNVRTVSPYTPENYVQYNDQTGMLLVHPEAGRETVVTLPELRADGIAGLQLRVKVTNPNAAGPVRYGVAVTALPLAEVSAALAAGRRVGDIEGVTPVLSESVAPMEERLFGMAAQPEWKERPHVLIYTCAEKAASRCWAQVLGVDVKRALSAPAAPAARTPERAVLDLSAFTRVSAASDRHVTCTDRGQTLLLHPTVTRAAIARLDTPLFDCAVAVEAEVITEHEQAPELEYMMVVCTDQTLPFGALTLDRYAVASAVSTGWVRVAPNRPTRLRVNADAAFDPAATVLLATRAIGVDRCAWAKCRRVSVLRQP